MRSSRRCGVDGGDRVGSSRAGAVNQDDAPGVAGAQVAEPAGHCPTLKEGCQKLRGQKKIEMKYWIQLCSAAPLNAGVGRWGAAVLMKTPIRM